MSTAGERLVALAGSTGTSAALLLLIGSGATAGAALVNYSGLATGTAAEHLLADRAATQPTTGGGWVGTARRRKTENDEALLLLGLV